MQQLIYESDNYIIETGPSSMFEDREVYLVRNKRTNIIEVEESMLPKVVDYTLQLEEALGELDSSHPLFPEPDKKH